MNDVAMADASRTGTSSRASPSECKAARANGMRFGASFHAAHAWTWYEPAQDYDGNQTAADGKGKWWDGYDPQKLYVQRHPHSEGYRDYGRIHSQWG